MKNHDHLSHLLALGLQDGPFANEELDFSDIPDGDWRVGGYELLEEIGRGGMGVIYKARQPHSNRLVALKRLRPLGENEVAGIANAARLRREAEAVASLDHPHILPIYEVGLGQDGSPFFSMKLAVGGSLAQVAKPVEPRQAASWMVKVARGVQHAHGCGILHRDLKPANILLDGQNEPLVADFGLAKWMDRPSEMTQSVIIGTPGYLAPEQAQGKLVGFQTDVYSMGVILFELLSGRLPFEGEEIWSFLREASGKSAPPLREFADEIDLDLETICARCLEGGMTDRYLAAGDVADDLQRWLDGRPIIARPVSWPERSLRWARRNPVMALCGTTAMVLALLLCAQQYHQQSVERKLHQYELARRSLVILPFLDLESALPNETLPKVLENSISSAMAEMGACQVETLAEPPGEWTGAATSQEIMAASKATGARYVLTGIYRAYRNQPGKTPVTTIFLLKNDGKTLLGRWRWESEDPSVHFTKPLAREIFAILDSGITKKTLQKPDSSESNPVAASYIKVGRDLMQRRNLADDDRALACFESALREAPDSVLARAQIAVATMGRESKAPDPKIMERGLQAAREALAIAPDDAFANSAYAVLVGMQGNYQLELEHALKSVSYGQERKGAAAVVAYAYLMNGRVEMALRWFAKAKIASETPGEYDAFIGDCLAILGFHREAEAAYRSCSEFQPELPVGWCGASWLLLRQKKFAEAVALYHSKKDNYTNFPEVDRMGALIMFFSRNFEEARPLIKKLDNLHSGDGQYAAMDWRVAQICLGFTPNEESQIVLAQCIAREKKQLERLPDDNQAHYRLGAALAVSGSIDDSLSSLAKAIEKGWIDDVCLDLDPRWDGVRSHPNFQKIVSDLTQRKLRLAMENNLFATEIKKIKN